MARERIIEGSWNCTSCGARGVKARYKSCPGCGNPRERTGSESEFDFGEREASGAFAREGVTDPHALELAGAGADWFCAYCGAANRGDQGSCRTCSAEREAAASPAPAPPPAAPARPSRLGRGLLLGCAAPLLTVVCGVCAYFFWAIQTHDYAATVVKREWSRTAKRESFTRVQKQGWRDELRVARAVMPVNGGGESGGLENVRDCRRAQRGTRQVPDGTERVCETKSRRVACGTEERCHTRDLGNGFAKEVCEDVPKYCSEPYEECADRTRYRSVPVYAESCTFDTWEWRPAGELTVSGGEDPPRWPDLMPGPLDRLVRSEAYAVDFEYRRKDERRTVTHRPRGLEEFQGWRPGTTTALVIRNDGGLKAIRRNPSGEPSPVQP